MLRNTIILFIEIGIFVIRGIKETVERFLKFFLLHS